MLFISSYLCYPRVSVSYDIKGKQLYIYDEVTHLITIFIVLLLCLLKFVICTHSKYFKERFTWKTSITCIAQFTLCLLLPPYCSTRNRYNGESFAHGCVHVSYVRRRTFLCVMYTVHYV